MNQDSARTRKPRSPLAPETAQFLTLRQAATELQVSEATLRRSVHRGEISATLIGTALRIRRADLESYVASRAWTPALCASETARPRAGRRKARKPATPAGPVGSHEATGSEAVAAPSDGSR